MKAKRLAFVTRIAKHLGLIPKNSWLETSKYSPEYRVCTFDEEGEVIEIFRQSLYVFVDKLKSGKYAVRIKQRGKWEPGLGEELQKAFNKNRIVVTQRENRGMVGLNVLQLTCVDLPWRYE